MAEPSEVAGGIRRYHSPETAMVRALELGKMPEFLTAPKGKQKSQVDPLRIGSFQDPNNLMCYVFLNPKGQENAAARDTLAALHTLRQAIQKMSRERCLTQAQGEVLVQTLLRQKLAQHQAVVMDYIA
jgi:hypothetical protein